MNLHGGYIVIQQLEKSVGNTWADFHHSPSSGLLTLPTWHTTVVASPTYLWGKKDIETKMVCHRDSTQDLV